MDQQKEDDLFKITLNAWSFVPFNSIKFSIEENIFSLIEKGFNTIEKLSNIKTWKMRPTKALVELLESFDLLKHSDDVLVLTDTSKKFLSPDSEFYIGDFYIRNQKLQEAYSDLGDLMTKDEPNHIMNEYTKASFGLNFLDETPVSEFGKPMLSASKVILFDFINKYKINQDSSILDIGAGLGALEEVLKDHKGNITILETPEVAKVAELNLKNRNNLTFIKENWTSWEPKEQYDMVFLNHVLHEEELSTAKNLFTKAVKSTKKGGKLIVISFMRGDENFLKISKIFQLNLLLEMGSDLPSLKHLKDWSNSLDLKEERVLNLPGGRAAWIAIKN